MRLLLSAGADCNRPPAEAAGITARSKSLQWVFRSHWLDFFARSILEWRHSNCFSLTSLGAFPYANLNYPEAAISSRNPELTKVLLGLGADANAPGTFVEDKTVMQSAIIAADFKALQLQLERGAWLPADFSILSTLQRLEQNGLYLTDESTTIANSENSYHWKSQKFTELIELVV
ncbi:hypothetical protein I7I50_04169 [Histoplasma capsulatum G186AR]|nr:hypothetical protein I7I52_05077 [Histoplasma capsulatum]QSS75129.1 hypothetical protein I7I50_04169 [Histoplasma capsulatum G186AR]